MNSSQLLQLCEFKSQIVVVSSEEASGVLAAGLQLCFFNLLNQFPRYYTHDVVQCSTKRNSGKRMRYVVMLSVLGFGCL